MFVLDKEGNALIAKYYNSPDLSDKNMRDFETRLFKASKASKSSSFESNSFFIIYCLDGFFSVDGQMAFFRVYDDISMFVVGAENDWDLVISEVLDTIHECFDEAFSHVIDRESLINNMTAVILIIDELIDGGIIMASESSTILDRINIKLSDSKKSTKAAAKGKKEDEKQPEPPASTGGGYYSFASVFSNAKNSFAKTLGL